MKSGRPKAELVIAPAEREQLAALARSRSLPAALVLRARRVLACESDSNQRVAPQLKIPPATVGKWRRRFIALRRAGWHDELRPGKPRSIEDERLAELIPKTLPTKPATATHGSVREMALETGMSKSAVHRFFQLFGWKPPRQETFKLSTDPFFIEKGRDVVGLYLSPPDPALGLGGDEKSQGQALERTQPLLPLELG